MERYVQVYYMILKTALYIPAEINIRLKLTAIY